VISLWHGWKQRAAAVIFEKSPRIPPVGVLSLIALWLLKKYVEKTSTERILPSLFCPSSLRGNFQNGSRRLAAHVISSYHD
jgi:hypothetical protein